MDTTTDATMPEGFVTAGDGTITSSTAGASGTAGGGNLVAGADGSGTAGAASPGGAGANAAGDADPADDAAADDDMVGDDDMLADDDDVVVAPTTGVCQPGVPTTSQVPRLTNAQYNAVVGDLLGVTSLGGSAPAANFEPDSAGELPSTQWAQYQSTAAQLAAEAMAGPMAPELTCAVGDATCLHDVIATFGRKAFRRPLTDAEIESFMTLGDVEPAGTAEEIAEALIYTFLISPSFLMRTELDAPTEVVPGTEAAPQTAYKLSNHEVASRLSFLIWNSMPDDALNAAADAGQLQTREQILAQAQRMIGPEFRSKVEPVVAAAHRFYANIDENSSTSRWGRTRHSAADFPEYSDAQTQPLMDETAAFFGEVGLNGSFEDLFLSNVAFVNQDTAALYGLNPADYGAALTRVELEGTERPGFLTRAGFLSSYAHPSDTSPILRGVFMLTLMGGATGTPSADAFSFTLPDNDYKTNREAVQALTSVRPDCQACHWTNINPPGFVLENFSAVGSVQTTDPVYGGPIDTAVEAVNFPAGMKPINNAYELMQEIAAGRRTKEIYAEKWIGYATGRPKNDFDQCTSNAIADKLAAGDYALINVLADLTQAESFRLRAAAE